MKKEIICLIFIFLILEIAGFVSAEKIGIEFLEGKDNYIPGEYIDFKIVLYDDNNKKIDGQIQFSLINYYKDIIYQGITNSGEKVSVEIPSNAIKGHWGVRASYKEVVIEELFNVLESEKLDIKLEGDNLIISNLGNIPIMAKQISISIGEHDETALVSLEIGQSKTIRLTAPPGEYDIKVSDGTEKNTFEVSGVSLTGNVIGLENVSKGGFFKKYPLISLFLVALGLVVAVVIVLKVKEGSLSFRKS